MNSKEKFYIQNLTNSPSHYRYHSPIVNDIQPRRNSYQMAIHISKQDRLQYLYSSSSSISSINEPINTTQSLYTIHDGCSYCINDQRQRSLSQPAVRSLDNDILLQNATLLLDSPVHALRPAHHKLIQTFSPNNPLLTRNSSTANESSSDSNSSTISLTSIYRIVLLRSFASVFALASLFSTEVLQTSIYSNEHSFQSLFLLNLSSSIAAFIFAAHASHIQITRFRWKISNVLAYDRCSQILIIFSTIFTSTWILMQYFHKFYHLLLVSASISGISLSCMLIKTFDHLLQLSTRLPSENMKILTIRFNLFIFIYNSICHLSLTIGGVCLFISILIQQWKYNYILIASQTCILIPCLFKNNEPLSKISLINLTMYSTENKQS